MSTYVASIEPDLSQLMEDLEVVNREKELLLQEKVASERKCKEYNLLLEDQAREFKATREVLQVFIEILFLSFTYEICIFKCFSSYLHTKFAF